MPDHSADAAPSPVNAWFLEDTHVRKVVHLKTSQQGREAQARMGVSAAQAILFVDDRAANVDGARMAGWRAMLYRGPESLSRALASWG